jgi:hypothetical protein
VRHLDEVVDLSAHGLRPADGPTQDRFVKDEECFRRLGPLEQFLSLLAPIRNGVSSHEVVLVVGGALAAWPRTRRMVGDRVRSVVVQHRLRTAFRELSLTSWSGRAPAIIWSAPCPEGLRVHLACPAGISADDLVEEREALAAACYAADVRVERDPRHATVVVLVVVTRIPLVPGPIPYTGT